MLNRLNPGSYLHVERAQSEIDGVRKFFLEIYLRSQDALLPGALGCGASPLTRREIM